MVLELQLLNSASVNMTYILRGPKERTLQTPVSRQCTSVLYCVVLCCTYIQQTQGERDEPDQGRLIQARPGVDKKVQSEGMVDTRPSLWGISITIPTRMRLATGDLYSKQNSRRDATMDFGLKSHYTLGRKGKRRKEKKGTVSDSAGL